MRPLIFILLILLSLACRLSGQPGSSTNTLNVPQTNEIRTLSLEDCLEMAVLHNFEVQIKRYNPKLAGLTLAGAYGAYEPSFVALGAHDYTQSPGGIDAQGRVFGGTETDANRVSLAFQGATPWGLSYNLGGRVTDTYGNRPDFTQTNLIRSPFENVSGNVGIFELRQQLLKNFWINPVRLQILLDKADIKISELDLRTQLMTTLTDVETAYYNLIFSRENVKVQQTALTLATRLSQENKKRVEVGTLARLDERQAESQAAATRADLLQAMGNADTQERVLKSLLSDDYSKWTGVSIQPTETTIVAVPEHFNLQESWERGLRLRPEIRQQILQLEKQGYIVRFQQNQVFPQLELIGDYGYNASSVRLGSALDQFRDQDNPFWSIGAQVSIPLGNRSARNAYKFAKATKEQLTLTLKQLEQSILIDIENAIAVANTAFQRVQATGEAKTYAREALEAEEKKLASGKSTSFEVLRLQRDLTSAHSAEIRALADYSIALAQIALKEGTSLERRHISVKVK